MNPHKNISHEIYLLQKKMFKKWSINQHSLLLVAKESNSTENESK